MFSLSKQVCLAQLHQMCLIVCRWEVSGREIHQEVCLPLIGCRQEMSRHEACEAIYLTEPDGKYDLVDFAFVRLWKKRDLWLFSGYPEMVVARVHRPGQHLIQGCFKLARILRDWFFSQDSQV